MPLKPLMSDDDINVEMRGFYPWATVPPSFAERDARAMAKIVRNRYEDERRQLHAEIAQLKATIAELDPDDEPST